MSFRTRRVLAALTLLAGLFVGLMGTANSVAAQDGTLGSEEIAVGPGLPAVTEVDATGPRVEVVVLNGAYDLDPDSISLVEGGQDISIDAVTTARALSRSTEIVFVFDVDNRVLMDGLLDDLRRAVIDETTGLPAEVSFGLVAAGEQASVETRMTNRVSALHDDLLGLQAEQGAAVYDAIDLAAKSFSDRSDTVRTIVAFTAGPDTASTLTAESASSAVVQAGAQLVTVDAADGDAGLRQIVGRVGGTGLRLTTPDQLDETVEQAMTVAGDRLILNYEGLAPPGERGSVALDVAGRQIDFSYPAGAETTGLLRLAPELTSNEGEAGLLGHPAVAYGSIALAFLGICLAVWSIGGIYFGGESTLDKRLARYSEGDGDLDEEEVQEMLVQSALIRRAVDLTESFAEQRGFLARIEELLERANLPIRPGEALFFASVIVAIVFGGVFVAVGSLIAAVVGAIVAAAVSFFVVQFIASRRLKQFEAQLPDTLQLLAGTLRAGYSLPQGLDAVGNEIADPMGYEIRRAMTEAQLGRELEDALSGIATRLDSPDFAWAVMAIGIQREVGGNLNELLMTVADTMVQRERLRREVNALTAEGRVSAGILSFMPPALGMVMYVMNPDYIGVLFSRTIGLVLVGLAFVSGLVGLLWMRKVITIDA